MSLSPGRGAGRLDFFIEVPWGGAPGALTMASS